VTYRALKSIVVVVLATAVVNALPSLARYLRIREL